MKTDDVKELFAKERILLKSLEDFFAENKGKWFTEKEIEEATGIPCIQLTHLLVELRFKFISTLLFRYQEKRFGIFTSIYRRRW